MRVLIENKLLGGSVRAIPSKSMAHRHFIAAALAEAPSRVVCPGMSEDIQATMDCLKAMGAIFNKKKSEYEVVPRTKKWSAGAGEALKLPCKESGSTCAFAASGGCAGNHSGISRGGTVASKAPVPSV